MKLYRLIAGILMLLAGSFQLNASHIAGAELTYTCSGNNLYNVRLVLFRDCSSSTQFDSQITLFVFNRTNNSIQQEILVDVPFNTPTIVPENWDACVATPYSLCVERATYTTQVQLPPNNAGYYFAWARCCRNSAISNLASPECEGVTFLANVPPASVAPCNSMPTFNKTPSIFLCAGMTYYFDHSATDSDGDSLVYSISNPFTGFNLNGIGTGNNSVSSCGSTLDPTVTSLNPMGPAPYANVVFSPGHSFSNPFGPGGYVNINPQTGYLEAFPASLGVYVMAVSVQEYRNGVLLSENKRDFQFHVIPCSNPGPPPVLTTSTGSLPVNGDTILVDASRPFCFDFTVTDILPSWISVTPISTIFGGNGGFPPPYATLTMSSNVPPVNGQICWTPACAYAGAVVPVILSARDTNDCPNYNIVFDTVWIRIVAPPPAPPVVVTDLGPLPSNGDTIILDVQQNFCYNFYVVDTLGGASLQSTHVITDLQGNLVPQTHTTTTNIVGDTLFGEVCWNTACNAGATYMMVTRGLDNFQCPPGNTSRDTVFLRITTPPNPPPSLGTSTLGNILSGDTILAEVKENFCFDFVVDDTSGISDSLGFQIRLEAENGLLAPGNAPTYSATGTTIHIEGSICWTPSCENVDSIYRFIVRGIQRNECAITNEDADTIWVRVTEPIKPQPLISHDLGQGPGNNSIVQVADQDSFCYAFQLQDTVSPAELRYTLNVFDANGAPYFGTAPVVTLSVDTDSIMIGTVCWVVPCALSDQQFMLEMVGRDTFDCRISNWIRDTVYVNHTENIPPTVPLCNVSVTVGDEGVEMDWQPAVASDLAGYVVHRKAPGEQNFTLLATIMDPNASAYVDSAGVNADAGSYCYEVYSIDRCGRTSLAGTSFCTVLLDGETEGYSSNITWQQPIQWPEGVNRQEIHRNYPELPGNPSEMIQSLGEFERAFQDATIVEPRNCYRVRVVAEEGGCGVESWSNDVCLNFPPTLFVPSAFTPNGDGLNDYFTSFGEFEAGFHLQVWDRWGKLVFDAREPQPGWQGDFRGKPMPEGVYVYRIEVTGYDGQVLSRSGSVTLLR